MKNHVKATLAEQLSLDSADICFAWVSGDLLSVWHFFLDLPLDEDEGEGCRIALLLGPHTLVAAVRNLEEFWC